MNFTEWLTLDEGNRNRGPVGGAFGNNPRRMAQAKMTKKPVITSPSVKPSEETPLPINAPAPNDATRQPPPQQRLDNRFQGIDQRVQYGKSIEKQIFDHLVDCGLKLHEPSGREDMYDKIDGWWEREDGLKPIQIKYRDTGDDILFEVMKDINRNVPGRDMIGKAIYYAVANREGTRIVVVSVDDAKQLIEEMRDRAEREGFDNRGTYRMGGAMLRIREDPRSGQDKLMAFIPVNMLKQVVPICSASIKF